MDDVQAYIQASKGVMDIAKTMIGMLPKGQHHDDAEGRLAQAEKALHAAEVQLAKSLGYNLCQCTFPPQIMLRMARHPVHGTEIYKCDSCNNQEPSEHVFAGMDKMKRANESLSGNAWMAR
jgi:hypothetical protein